MPAAESSAHQQTGLPPAKEGKEKKEKPKSKTAQQVRHDPGLTVLSAELGLIFCFVFWLCLCQLYLDPFVYLV